ncbi:hypothetical protein CUJ83_07470 [Methanocella sp. CWC-04]|uniref:Uncharacterized protein n=1 Tax=Methanooceanicella nereidis TaxID=2052831 RepID=A0AAP2W787_9EURY|nr:hypothetical protein [Methanocella sp. CWC-04]
MTISPDVPGIGLASLAMCLHNLIGRMPVIIKSRLGEGVMVEDGAVNDGEQLCNELDCALFDDMGDVIRTNVNMGKHTGLPIFISPVRDREGNNVAAIGIIDTSGMLTLKEFVDVTTRVRMQLQMWPP